MGEYTRLNRVDEFYKTNPSKDEFIAFLEAESFNQKDIDELCDKYEANDSAGE